MGQPFDVDGIEVVADLGDLRWDRYYEGRHAERHIGARVVENSGAWATVIVAVKDLRTDRPCPVRYVLARYRREGGAWRLRNHFRLPRRTLDALIELVPDFVSECGS